MGGWRDSPVAESYHLPLADRMKLGLGFALSPDHKWLAYGVGEFLSPQSQNFDQVFVTNLASGAQNLVFSFDTLREAAVLVRDLYEMRLVWSQDGRVLYLDMGYTYYKYDVVSRTLTTCRRQPRSSPGTFMAGLFLWANGLDLSGSGPQQDRYRERIRAGHGQNPVLAARRRVRAGRRQG